MSPRAVSMIVETGTTRHLSIAACLYLRLQSTELYVSAQRPYKLSLLHTPCLRTVYAAPSLSLAKTVRGDILRILRYRRLQLQDRFHLEYSIHLNQDGGATRGSSSIFT